MAGPLSSGRVSAGFKTLKSGADNPFQYVGKDIAESKTSPLSIPLKVLELLGRPASAVSGFVTGLQRGSISKAFSYAGDAVTGDKFFQFKDVLKRAGISELGSVDAPLVGKITGRGVLGFGMDVLLDPLSYVGLSSLTKAGREGRRIRQFSKTQSESILKINKSFSEQASASFSARKQALLNRAKSEVTAEYDTGVAAAKEAWEEVNKAVDFQVPQGLSQYAAKAQTTNKLGEVIDTIVRRDANMLRDIDGKVKRIGASIDRNVVPNWQASWRLQAKEAFAPELANIKDVIHADEMLDLAVQANRQVDVLRQAADISPVHIGATRASQTAAGNRSSLTFMGRSPSQIAKTLGLPDLTTKRMQELDVMVQRGIDKSFQRVGTWPVFKQMRELFNRRATGYKEIDGLLQLYEAKGANLSRQAFIDGMDAVSNQMLKEGGKSPEQVNKLWKEVGKVMEWDNPNNILGEAIPDGVSEEARDIALGLRERLDMALKAEGKAGVALGFSTSYLKGYFPRNLTKDVKEAFDAAMPVSVKNQIFLSAGMQRKGSFANLTTEEINTLFRENRLGLDSLEEALKKDKTLLEKIRKVDPETADFFIDDPAQAVAARLADSARVVNNRQFIGKMFELFGRRITSQSAKRQMGEVLVAPTAISEAYAKGELKSPGQIRDSVRKVLGLRKNEKSEEVNKIIDTFEAMRTDSLVNVNNIDEAGNAGQAMKLLRNLDSDNPHLLSELAERNVPFYAMDSQVVEHINNVWMTRRDGFGMSKIGKMYDGITQIWKKYTLSIIPAFHIRNVVSDIAWMNHMAGVTTAKEIFSKNGAYPKALQILGGTTQKYGKIRVLKDADIAAGGVSIRVVADNGAEFSGEQLWREFEQNGNLNGLYASAETSSTGLTFRQLAGGTEPGQKIPSKYNPIKDSFLPIKWGNQAGDFLQTWARFSHFIAKRKAGYGAEEATMSVKKFLFDYDDLTTFERKTMKRVFPFYTWMRKNIPLQLEQMIKQPGKFANLQKAIKNAEDPEARKNIPEGGLPDFIKREFGIPIRQNGDRTDFLLLGSWVPAADLVRFGDLQSVLHTGAKSLNPLIKALIEYGTNFNIFQGMPTEQYPGEKGKFLGIHMDKKKIQLLRNIRAAAMLDRVAAPEDPNSPFRGKNFSVAERLLDVGVGVRPIQVDTQKTAQFQQRQANRISNKLKKALEAAKKIGDKEGEEFLRDMISDAEVRRR